MTVAPGPQGATADLFGLLGLFQQAPAAVAWLEGPEHVFRLANDAFLALADGRDVLGNTVAQALPEIVGQGFVSLLDEVYRSGRAYVGSSVPVRLQRGGGQPLQERLLDFVYQPLLDATGAVAGIFVQATDATERVRASGALQASEARLRAITDSIDQMIWSTLPDGFHDYYNQRWYEYTGVPEGTTDGEGWNGMFHPDDQPRAWAVWRHSLQSGEPYHIEYRLRHRSGQYRWVLGRAQPVRDADGRIVRWFGTCTDIQEIVDAREVRRRSGEELERLVKQRTGQLMDAEERLRHAQKMEAVGQLTGGIAHDFNNMLQGITGALDLSQRLLAAGRAAEIPRYLEMAMGSAQRAASMTHRLLAFSRRQPLAPQVLDVNALIESLRELLQRTMGEAIEVRLELEPRAWHSRCDPHQLESALLNLAINARDAMGAGGLLTLCTSNDALGPMALPEGEESPGGDYVCIAVRDSGAGMEDAVVKRAFEPFFTTKPIGEGTGLGLSMVYGFIRQSLGMATIASRPGEGSTVRLFLPRVEGPATPPAAHDSASELGVGMGRKVLVVEDDEVVRVLVLQALRDVGYHPLGAASGPEALRIVDRLPELALLLTDIGLPGGLNGRQVAEVARQRWPQLKVLFMTGYIHAGAQPQADQAEGMNLVTKPVRLDTLLRRVQELIGGGSGPVAGA